MNLYASHSSKVCRADVHGLACCMQQANNAVEWYAHKRREFNEKSEAERQQLHDHMQKRDSYRQQAEKVGYS